MCNKRNSTKIELRNGRIIKIDDCMVKRVTNTHHNTLGCCCGHGRYKKTIVCKDKGGAVYELHSGVYIPRKRGFYFKDKKGFYFIPEVENEK